MSIFIQAHQDAFWDNSKSDTMRHFSLAPTTDSEMSVDVVASVQGDCLQLSYFLKGDVDFDISPTTLHRADFLWEKTCLECFFDFGQSGYVELNFAPTGEFNLYTFDDYRTPNALPPRWANGSVFALSNTPLQGYHVYHLGVKLDDVHHMSIDTINPTAIIYQHGTPNFYATRHANPPDFHNKKFWQSF